MELFFKWFIVKTPVFPESVNCVECGKNLDTKLKVECTVCKTINNISNLIPKPRPVILWIEKNRWSLDGMTFGIPLSSDYENENFDDNYNQLIEIYDYKFFNPHNRCVPLRAAINQSTRIDGNAVLKNGRSVGVILNEVLKSKIEGKLKKWLGFNAND